MDHEYGPLKRNSFYQPRCILVFRVVFLLPIERRHGAVFFGRILKHRFYWNLLGFVRYMSPPLENITKQGQVDLNWISWLIWFSYFHHVRAAFPDKWLFFFGKKLHPPKKGEVIFISNSEGMARENNSIHYRTSTPPFFNQTDSWSKCPPAKIRYNFNVWHLTSL